MAPLIIIGRLTFPTPQAVDEWKGLRLSSQKFEWPDEFPLFTGESPRELATVSDVLGALGALDSPNFFELEQGSVRGFLVPEAVDAIHQDLASALRLAETVGAEGAVDFFVMGGGVAFHLPIGEQPDDHHHHHDHDHGEECDHDHDHGPGWVPGDALLSDEATSRRLLLVMEFVQAADEDPELTRTAFLERESTMGLGPLSEQPRHAELLERLSAQDPGKLHAALSTVTTREEVPLIELYPTLEALNVALNAEDAPLRAAGVELLARLDATAAEPFIQELLEDPSGHVQRHAVRALGALNSEPAFRQLLELDEREISAENAFTGFAIGDAIRESKLANADSILLETLSGTPFVAADWDDLDRIDQTEERAELEGQARFLLGLIGGRKLTQAEPRLLALFDDHPAEEVRSAAAQALAQLGGKGAQTRAEEIGLALHGMGKSLNQDDARRAELLGVDTKDESLGTKRFEDIDRDTLEMLLAERFTTPDLNQNDAPTIGQFFELLNEHPELKVGGYSVPIGRKDYRVSIDSIYVNIDEVPKERREDVAALFEELSETATNVEPEGYSHRCWWT